MNKRPFMKRF